MGCELPDNDLVLTPLLSFVFVDSPIIAGTEIEIDLGHGPAARVAVCVISRTFWLLIPLLPN